MDRYKIKRDRSVPVPVVSVCVPLPMVSAVHFSVSVCM